MEDPPDSGPMVPTPPDFPPAQEPPIRPGTGSIEESQEWTEVQPELRECPVPDRRSVREVVVPKIKFCGGPDPISTMGVG
jgi:hypothetical protein